jgi:hypothetical protein
MLWTNRTGCQVADKRKQKGLQILVEKINSNLIWNWTGNLSKLAQPETTRIGWHVASERETDVFKL